MENTTYLVEDRGFRAALHVHRPGCNSESEVRNELDRLQALRESALVRTPALIRGRDGRQIQFLRDKSWKQPLHMVLFEFVDVLVPDETQDLRLLFRELGETSALLHRHALAWQPPSGVTRFRWDLDAVFGAEPRWGSWRHVPNLRPETVRILTRLESVLAERLHRYGTGRSRYVLIHTDMRLADFTINDSGTWVIDFDDCGYGWFTYDFAAGVSFMEDDRRAPDLKEHGLESYCRHHKLPVSDRLEMDTMVMLRRMALPARVGSRIESEEPRRLAPEFADDTARAGKFLPQPVRLNPSILCSGSLFCSSPARAAPLSGIDHSGIR